MRVVVLGAGLLGVTTAYYLQQLGHSGGDRVVDRHATPAAGRPGSGRTPANLRLSCGARERRRPARGEQQENGPAVRQGAQSPSPNCFDRAIGASPNAIRSNTWCVRRRYSRKSVRALRDEAGNGATAALERAHELLHRRRSLPCAHGPRAPLVQTGLRGTPGSPERKPWVWSSPQAVGTQLAGATFSSKTRYDPPSSQASPSCAVQSACAS